MSFPAKNLLVQGIRAALGGYRAQFNSVWQQIEDASPSDWLIFDYHGLPNVNRAARNRVNSDSVDVVNGGNPNTRSANTWVTPSLGYSQEGYYDPTFSGTVQTNHLQTGTASEFSYAGTFTFCGFFRYWYIDNDPQFIMGSWCDDFPSEQEWCLHLHWTGSNLRLRARYVDSTNTQRNAGFTLTDGDFANGGAYDTAGGSDFHWIRYERDTTAQEHRLYIDNVHIQTIADAQLANTPFRTNTEKFSMGADYDQGSVPKNFDSFDWLAPLFFFESVKDDDWHTELYENLYLGSNPYFKNGNFNSNLPHTFPLPPAQNFAEAVSIKNGNSYWDFANANTSAQDTEDTLNRTPLAISQNTLTDHQATALSSYGGAYAINLSNLRSMNTNPPFGSVQGFNPSDSSFTITLATNNLLANGGQKKALWQINSSLATTFEPKCWISASNTFVFESSFNNVASRTITINCSAHPCFLDNDAHIFTFSHYRDST
jgi:hypothetical protein